MAIDIATLPAGLLEDEDFIAALQRPDVRIRLVHLASESALPGVTGWKGALPDTDVSVIAFDSVEGASTMGDAVEFGVSTSHDGEVQSVHRAHFFPAHVDFDIAEGVEDPLPKELRVRTAALAAAARALEARAVVTAMPTVDRADVAENDWIAICDPDGAIALIGHSLRMSGSRRISVTPDGRGTVRLRSLVGLYSTCIEAKVPFLRLMNFVAATGFQDQEVVTATRTADARLQRAARAVDDLLRALSRIENGELDDDSEEEISEAFDRELLYIMAAVDTLGRMHERCINTAVAKPRSSLHSRATFEKLIDPYYPDAPELPRLHDLQLILFFANQLRNYIHATRIDAVHAYTRDYGSGRTAVINLDVLPSRRDHAYNLGIWRAATEPTSPGPQPIVADLATMATALLESAFEFVNLYSFMVLKHTPVSAPSPALIFAKPMTVDGPLKARRVDQWIGRLFGWSVPALVPTVLVD
ncbi:hypothetical protein [Rhodococcus wratislaviensis]|uniref:Uncharacterized protein n=1 Tax=Rhodococcus wratislaviensis NBRC 100605 TaxID=1219028 RepID=X0Q5J7_RHOWR|nr:hypothetical protein [Rhodococcus wratislaviensis]GAF46527.1 hypothetical protein RW1_031_01110 [Rhodococcus wratislaviensis NBRC 100605]